MRPFLYVQSPLYRPIGKMFMLSPHDEMIGTLQSKAAKCEQKLKVSATALETLKKQEEEADKAFLEIVETIRNKQARS